MWTAAIFDPSRDMPGRPAPVASGPVPGQRRLRPLVLTGLVVLALLGSVLALWIATRIAVARIEAAHPPAGRFVTVPGGRLHVIEAGLPEGQAQASVLFLHGASSNAADPLFALASRLQDRYRLIAIDRPGHGWSERPGGAADASPARQAAGIRAALAALTDRPVIVVAHSLAGAVGTALALDHPDAVAGLVLLAPVTHPWPGGIAWYYHVATAPVLGPLFVHTLAVPVGLAVLEAGASSVFAPQRMPGDYLDRAGIRLLMRPATFAANAQDVAGLHAFVSRQQDRYSQIRVPTSIITGDVDDTVSPVIHSAAIARQIAGARHIVLPNVGHQPHYAAPDVVAAEIDAVAAPRRAGALP